MFAENIIQAALEQVKTTRGNPLECSISERTISLPLDYIFINETEPPKIKFTTRYVSGTNFLGNRSSFVFLSLSLHWTERFLIVCVN